MWYIVTAFFFPHFTQQAVVEKFYKQLNTIVIIIYIISQLLEFTEMLDIQGVPGGMWNTSGECSLC